jgi:hypothetical protein
MQKPQKIKKQTFLPTLENKQNTHTNSYCFQTPLSQGNS